MGYNRVTFRGNLSADPVQRQAGASSICVFNIAVSEKRKQNDTVETWFMDVNVWGARGDSCAQYLKKGSSVLIGGKLKQDKWQTDTGETKYKFYIVADEVEFLTPKSQESAMPLKKAEPKPEHLESLDPNNGQGFIVFDEPPF